ncbi:MAG: hypothetical protein ACI4SG_06620, partial [Oligosphaeraceae bacterium]
FCYNPMIPGTPMDWSEWYDKDPAGGWDIMDSGAADKSAWHKVLHCPSCPTSDRVIGNIGYQVNVSMSYMGQYKEGSSTGTGWQLSCDWHRLSSIKYPSIFVNVMDGNRQAIWERMPYTHCDYVVSASNSTVRDGYFRHSTQMNVSFSDGHVEAIPVSKAINKDEYGTPYLVSDYYWFPGYNTRYGGDIR